MAASMSEKLKNVRSVRFPSVRVYRSQYIIAGIEAIVRVWVTRGFQESVEEIVAITNRAHQQQIPLSK
jgi:hypothetical protein